MNKGLLVVISGPSGCGKGVICSEFIKRNDDTCLSISATTRDMRPGEEEGVTYFYKSKEQFEQMIADDEVLEYAQVYSGHYYGTPKNYVFSKLDEGKNVILEIEMQGASNIKKKVPESVLIFLAPPSKQELEKRITGRGRESAELIRERLSLVNSELARASEYDYVVVNDEIDKCVKRIEAIFKAEKCSQKRNEDFIQKLIEQ